jgi:hypothetical protein
VILIPNTGTAAAPKLHDAARRAIEAGGAPIEVPGGDAGPFVADWDRDGALDLIVGAGDGSVWLYRNEGKPREPRFAAGVALLPKSAYGHETVPAQGEPLRSHGTRTKPCAVDVDNDSWPDLLVGDFQPVARPEPELTAEQIARRDALRGQRDELDGRMQARFEELAAAGQKVDFEKDESLSAVFAEIEKVSEELAPLEAGQDLRGHVWYLRRIPPTSGVAAR